MASGSPLMIETQLRQRLGAGTPWLFARHFQVEHIVRFPGRLLVDNELGHSRVLIRVVVQVLQFVRSKISMFSAEIELV